MNLGRVKSYLIFLFLAINIYLIVSLVMSYSFKIDDTTINNTVEILKQNNISVDKNIILQKTKNLKNIETFNIIYTDEFKESENYKDFQISGNSFVYTTKNTKVYNMSDGRIIKQIKKILTDSSFDLQYMKFSPVNKDKKAKTVEIQCYIKDYCVFDSRIIATISKSGITLSGSWYEPQTSRVISNTKTRKTAYITSVLIDLCENADFKNSKEVTNIEFGYLAGSLYGNSGHITATALPYYRLTDEKGNVYFYDASDGSYNASVGLSNSQ